jgi:hypothetical protein
MRRARRTTLTRDSGGGLQKLGKRRGLAPLRFFYFSADEISKDVQGRPNFEGRTR